MTNLFKPIQSSLSAVGFRVDGDHAHGATRSSERLSGDQVLPVNVGHGCRLANIGVVPVLLRVHARPLRPHRGHGDIVGFFHLHAIADGGASLFMRLAILAHASRVQRLSDLAIMIFGYQVCECFAPVP